MVLTWQDKFQQITEFSVTIQYRYDIEFILNLQPRPVLHEAISRVHTVGNVYDQVICVTVEGIVLTAAMRSRLTAMAAPASVSPIQAIKCDYYGCKNDNLFDEFGCFFLMFSSLKHICLW